MEMVDTSWSDAHVSVPHTRSVVWNLDQLDMWDTNLSAVMNEVRQNPSSPFTYLHTWNEEWGNGDLTYEE